MVDPSFESLIQRYEMGQAYLKITEQMGPSPQLLAFVNHNTLDLNNIGLESLGDLDTIHQLIVDEINNDPSLHMATEALADRVRKVSDYVMKGGAIVFVASLLGFPFGNLSFGAMVSGAIVKKISGMPTSVVPYTNYQEHVNAVDNILAEEIDMASHIPTTFTKEVWKDFNDKLSKLKGKYTEINIKLVPVDRSGWTEHNLSEAAKWLQKTAEKVERLQKSFGVKLENIDKWVEKDHKGDPEAAVVLKYISSSIGVTYELFSNTTHTLGMAKTALNSAAHLFEESKK